MGLLVWLSEHITWRAKASGLVCCVRAVLLSVPSVLSVLAVLAVLSVLAVLAGPHTWLLPMYLASLETLSVRLHPCKPT